MKPFNFIVILFLSFFVISCSTKDKVLKFALVSDFYAQDVPDGKQRHAFIDAAKKNKVSEFYRGPHLYDTSETKKAVTEIIG